MQIREEYGMCWDELQDSVQLLGFGEVKAEQTKKKEKEKKIRKIKGKEREKIRPRNCNWN